MMVADVCMFFISFFLALLVWSLTKRIPELELHDKALWEKSAVCVKKSEPTGRELRLWRRTVTTMIIVFLFEAIVTVVLVLLLEVGVYAAVELINMIRDSIKGD